jgi:hypothetical protein
MLHSPRLNLNCLISRSNYDLRIGGSDTSVFRIRTESIWMLFNLLSLPKSIKVIMSRNRSLTIDNLNSRNNRLVAAVDNTISGGALVNHFFRQIRRKFRKDSNNNNHNEHDYEEW